ncbi:MAG: hydrogenase formation protein HypD [Cyanobacteria bacterium]|nr:hydrogenase formation protein HypD [Cyanobacteriota bacterium]
MAELVAELVAELAATSTRPWTLMEVCGGQTHAIVRWGLDQLLPPGLRLLHGPGCPVCVTPAETIDQALALACRPELILCAYGDMLRVPGSPASGDGGLGLLGARAGGGDVRLLTSPLQALDLARANPQRQVVFLAVGFETTAPATALLADQTLALGLTNLSLLMAHVRVAPAMEAILAFEDNPCGEDNPDGAPGCLGLPGPPGSARQRQPTKQRRPTSRPSPGVQGFLAAGHVAAVLGTGDLADLVTRRRRPVVVTGFEPAELLAGILRCVQLLEAGTPQLANAYGRVVRPGGNPAARALLERVFVPVDQPWRGLGLIQGGGLALAPAYASLDARQRFGLTSLSADRPPGPARTPHGPGAGWPGGEPPAPSAPLAPSAPPPDPCLSGAILLGRATPPDCPAFGAACTPERPLGAPMVSTEGACAAYYRYRRQDRECPQNAAVRPASPPLPESPHG